MRNPKVQVSLYVTVPLIVAGMTLLSALASYHNVRLAVIQGRDPFWPFVFGSLVLVLIALALGLLIAGLFLKPMQAFMARIDALGMSRRDQPDREEEEIAPAAPDELKRFTQVSDRVTEMISQLDASERFPDIVQHSDGMIQVLSLVARIAPSEVSVLILGESGTGKELIARSIHRGSPRNEKPFVAINCAGIPEALLESELFGHEKGSFTHAVRQKIGKFELADGGTLFLDEIADMPSNTQAKILRAIQEREIERVGGNAAIPVSIRVVAATNRDIEAMVREGTFREDLYFRLNAFTLRIPPLRERRSDIPSMARYFLGEGHDLSAAVMSRLSGYDWPGNVRELKNVIETASALAEDTIEPQHLPAYVSGLPTDLMPPNGAENGRSLDEILVDYEKGMIIDALGHSAGIQKEAAQFLGIKERSLWHRISKYQIDVSAIRQSNSMRHSTATNHEG